MAERAAPRFMAKNKTSTVPEQCIAETRAALTEGRKERRISGNTIYEIHWANNWIYPQTAASYFSRLAPDREKELQLQLKDLK